MTDNDFMKVVINKGMQRLEKKLNPCISIIVKDNLIISEGHGTVGEYELSGHNDLNCINKAAKKLKTYDLSGCTMYSTIEPCSMCLAGAAWAGLERIVFGAFQEDILQNPYELIDYHAINQAQKLRTPNGKKIDITGGVLRVECSKLMENVKDWMVV